MKRALTIWSLNGAVVMSRGGKGNCYENAAAETFFETFKAELIWRRSWDTKRKAEMTRFECINGFMTCQESTQRWVEKFHRFREESA